MYNLGEVQETTGIQPMNAGIRENIKLADATFESMGEGNDPVIQLTFEDEFGGSHRELLWDVDADRIKEWNTGDKVHGRDDQKHGFVKGQPITDEDAVIKAQELFAQRAKHIALRFVNEQTLVEATKNATNYNEFGTAFVGVLTPEVREKTRVRLKVTLNGKDYTQLPKYPPFIENMEVPKEASKLSIDPRYDRVTKATVESADDPTSFDPTSFDDPGF